MQYRDVQLNSAFIFVAWEKMEKYLLIREPKVSCYKRFF